MARAKNIDCPWCFKNVKVTWDTHLLIHHYDKEGLVCYGSGFSYRKAKRYMSGKHPELGKPNG